MTKSMEQSGSLKGLKLAGRVDGRKQREAVSRCLTVAKVNFRVRVVDRECAFYVEPNNLCFSTTIIAAMKSVY